MLHTYCSENSLKIRRKNKLKCCWLNARTFSPDSQSQSASLCFATARSVMNAVCCERCLRVRRVRSRRSRQNWSVELKVPRPHALLAPSYVLIKMAAMEGYLSKWTNVMKGWQYRWFILDDNAGLMSYYTVSTILLCFTPSRGPRGPFFQPFRAPLALATNVNKTHCSLFCPSANTPALDFSPWSVTLVQDAPLWAQIRLRMGNRTQNTHFHIGNSKSSDSAGTDLKVKSCHFLNFGWLWFFLFVVLSIFEKGVNFELKGSGEFA